MTRYLYAEKVLCKCTCCSGPWVSLGKEGVKMCCRMKVRVYVTLGLGLVSKRRTWQERGGLYHWKEIKDFFPSVFIIDFTEMLKIFS